MIKIEELVWDNWNIEHIGKHGVKVIEAEEACSYGSRYEPKGKKVNQ